MFLWKIGGNGLAWSGNDTTSILIDFETAPRSIQPVYLTSDRSVFSHLDNWSALRVPRDLGFVDGERPRIWRGGSGSESPNSNGTYLVDGDSTTFNVPGRPGDFYTIDLAVPVPANRFGFFTPPRGFRTDGTPLKEDVVRSYEVTISAEGDPAWLETTGYQRIGPAIADVRENFGADVQLEFPRQYVRYIRYRRNQSAQDEIARTASSAQAVEGQGTIGDFELFGEGIPRRAIYVSKIIDLGREVNFGRLLWTATPLRRVDGAAVETPEAAVSLKIEVRTGRDDDPNVYHEFTNLGDEKVVSRQEYESLTPPRFAGGQLQKGKPGLRASIGYDTQNWTFWSPPFTRSGQPLVLKGGSFLQLKITLESQKFGDFVRLDSLWIEQAPLLARQIVGEMARQDDLWPARGFTQVELGKMTNFVYDIKAVFDASGQRGFDALWIRTSSLPLFRGLEIGDPLRSVEPERVVVDEEGLTVYLPERIARTHNLPLRVAFGAEVFVFANTFEAEVFDSASEALPQQVEAGDVSAAVNTSSLKVWSILAQREQIIENLRFSTPVVTPNGDGVNDQLSIEYSLFRLPDPVPVELNVYRLDGRRVARKAVGKQEAGPQQVSWDGRDGTGQILEPGLYLVDIAIDAESKTFRHLQPVGLAY